MVHIIYLKPRNEEWFELGFAILGCKPFPVEKVTCSVGSGLNSNHRHRTIQDTIGRILNDLFRRLTIGLLPQSDLRQVYQVVILTIGGKRSLH